MVMHIPTELHSACSMKSFTVSEKGYLLANILCNIKNIEKDDKKVHYFFFIFGL